MGLKQHFTRNEDYFVTSSENKSIEIEGAIGLKLREVQKSEICQL